jgi:hypothetical protein
VLVDQLITFWLVERPPAGSREQVSRPADSRRRHEKVGPVSDTPTPHTATGSTSTAEALKLDRLIRAGTIHSLTGQVYRCVGVRGAEIVAVSADPAGLDDLVGAHTTVVDAGDLTVLPAFADSHEHLMEASRNTLLVPVDEARSVIEFTTMVADAGRVAQPGEWVLTSIGWHESNLAENRLPTLAELDAAGLGHPVLARRGGHLAVVNSAALEAAGVGTNTPDPPGGKFERSADGSLNGAWKAGRCTRWPGSRHPRIEPNSLARWGPVRLPMPPWGWAPSAKP